MLSSMPPVDSLRDPGGLPPADLRFLLTFRLGELRFAVPVDHVLRVAEIGPITPLPRAPAHVPGMVLVGSRAVPVLDLQRFLGVAEVDAAVTGDEESAPRLVVVAAGSLEVALRCSWVRIERDVAPERLREPEAIQGERLRQFTVAEMENEDGVVAVLEVPALLAAAQPRG